MDIQEAIDMLIFPVFIVPTEAKYISFEEYSEARQLAVKALEKQIAKKPIPGSSYLHRCPVCNFRLTIYKDNYCDECGQKLDWRENERL